MKKGEPNPHGDRHRWSRSPCTEACGRCPMLGGALPCLWVVPYAGRNPPNPLGAKG